MRFFGVQTPLCGFSAGTIAYKSGAQKFGVGEKSPTGGLGGSQKDLYTPRTHPIFVEARSKITSLSRGVLPGKYPGGPHTLARRSLV